MSEAEIWETVIALSILYPIFLLGMIWFWYKDVYCNREYFKQEDEEIKQDAERNAEIALTYQISSALARELLAGTEDYKTPTSET